MSWSDIPKELLRTIFQNLTKNVCRLPDLYRCLHVCQSWRIVAKEVWQSSTVVALLIPGTEEPNNIVFNTSLLNSRKSTRLAFNNDSSVFGLTNKVIPKNLKLKTYASHGGWLLVGQKYRDHLVFLYNPVSRVFIRLPPLPSRLNFYHDIYFVMSESSPTDPKCIICVSNYIDFLAFYKPAKRSKSWVLSEKPYSSRIDINSMIFCCENFYTVDHNGALFEHSGALLDFITNDDEKNAKKTWPWPVKGNKVASTPDDDFHVRSKSFIYLVKSKSGKLLMVDRVHRKLITSTFCVYNYDCYSWKKTNSLGENEALIMGCKHEYISISVNKHNIETYKPNCIYFFDQIPGPGKLWGYGRYNLERGHIYYWDDFHSDDKSGSHRYKYNAEPRLFTPSVTVIL